MTTVVNFLYRRLPVVEPLKAPPSTMTLLCCQASANQYPVVEQREIVLRRWEQNGIKLVAAEV